MSVVRAALCAWLAASDLRCCVLCVVSCVTKEVLPTKHREVASEFFGKVWSGQASA